MIKNASRILRISKTLVDNEDDEIWVDYDNKHFLKVIEANQVEKSALFPNNEPALKSTLSKLENEGYIKSTGINYYKLTEKGFHYYRYVFSDIRSFLFRSIITPIIVSALTTLITLWLKELL